jgi:hypothetical protein
MVRSSQAHPISTGLAKPKVEQGIREIRPGVYEVRSSGVSRATDRGIRAPRKLRAKLVTDVAGGKYGGSKTTLGFCWTNAAGKAHTGARRTLAEEHRRIDKDIRSAIGSIPLVKLTPKDLDIF